LTARPRMTRPKSLLPPGIIAVGHDHWGRQVALTERAMKKIVRDHLEFDGHHLAIMSAVQSAEIRCRGRKSGRPVPDREVLWAKNIGPGPWLRVVVRYEGHVGHVITAYAGKRPPEASERI
jgi:hypothetical protein